MAENETRERLLVVGAPVVATASGRIELSGELTDEQAEQLGPAKVESLRRTGYLRTEEEQAAEDQRLAALRENSASLGGVVNPNFGTPSMTPEAIKKAGIAPDSPLARMVEGGEEAAGELATDTRRSPGDVPVSELDLDKGTVQALEKAGIKTVGDVLRTGNEKGRLAGNVDGIGDAREKEIIAAIEKAEQQG